MSFLSWEGAIAHATRTRMRAHTVLRTMLDYKSRALVLQWAITGFQGLGDQSAVVSAAAHADLH